MGRRVSLDRAKALPHGGARFAFFAVFIGNDLKCVFERAQKLAGRQKKIWIARPAQSLVALAEGLEQEHAARREGPHEMREVRAVQVVRDNDGVEAFRGERPRSGFEIGRQDFDPWRVVQSAHVDVDRDHIVAHGTERAGMASMARGHVQDPPAGANQVSPAQDPRRRGDGGVGGTVEACHFASITGRFRRRSPHISAKLAVCALRLTEGGPAARKKRV
jgi:hypothetical protein